MNSSQAYQSFGRWLMLALSMACSTVAMAQSQGRDPGNARASPATAAMNSATTTSQQPQATAIDQAVKLPDSNVTIVTKPLAVTGGGAGSASTSARVLRIPTACTPKTNSLDCVQDSTQPGQGANVEGRVRNGVLGEVGTGKSTTEGRGGAKRDEACTPKAGELNCTTEPPAKP